MEDIAGIECEFDLESLPPIHKKLIKVGCRHGGYGMVELVGKRGLATELVGRGESTSTQTPLYRISA